MANEEHIPRLVAKRTLDPVHFREHNLWRMHPDGTGLRRITENPDDEFTWSSSSFSPDGRKIVTSRSPGVGAAGNFDVYVMNLDGSGLQNVTQSARWDSGPD